jgi:hypothetical protein
VMKTKSPPIVSVWVVILGIVGIAVGLGDTSGPSCGVAGMWKCLPGVVSAGRALFIGAGTFLAAMGALELVGGRRPWATAITLAAGAIGLAMGAWFVYSIAIGQIPLSDVFSVAWAGWLTAWNILIGLAFFAAALSDRVLAKLRR